MIRSQNLVLLLAFALVGCGARIVSSAGSQNPTQSAEQLAVTNVAAAPADSQSATVTWGTNLPSTSQVEYGTTTAYGSATSGSPEMVTAHSAVMAGLTPGTQYHYRVHSKTASNDEAISADYTVTTSTQSNGGGPGSFASLCSATPTGRTLNATPANYRSLMSTLKAGDTLSLAAGNYSLLVIRNLNGTSTNCITITGPVSGPPAVVQGVAGNNTVEISSSSYLVIKNLVIDSLGIDGAFGISAHSSSTPTHHILIQGNTLVGQNSGQETDGISTKTPTWGWVIRQNIINGAGTGLYLGNSDGSDPFVAGVIEDNLIENPIGYCMEIKYQLARPNIPGMPTTPSATIIRNNVFIKNDQPSPDGDRPNLLVGGFPDSGPGSTDMYEIYGNFFYHNPREALFQGSGRISFHDNILVDGQYTAAVFRDHNLPLKLAYVYNNTVYSTQAGITIGSAAREGEAVVGNAIFAATPLSGSITNQQGNVTDTFAHAALYVAAPSFTLGKMNFYPLPGKLQGSALPLMQFASDPDYNLDFNRTPKGTMTFRGAYAGSGTNPGWQLQEGIKVVLH